MGATHDAFVIPAILLDNPGISLEELAQKANRVRSVPSRDLFNSYESGGVSESLLFVNSDSYHQGIIALAKDSFGFDLKTSALNQDERDECGFNRLNIIPRHNSTKWLPPFYRVIDFIGEKIGDIAETFCWPGVFVGDKIFRIEKGDSAIALFYHKDGKVEEIRPKNSKRRFLVIEKGKSYMQEVVGGVKERAISIKVRELFPEYRIREFKTLKELLKKRPEFDPENLFDFSRTRGELSLGAQFYNVKLRWFRKNRGYYLDTEHLLDHVWKRSPGDINRSDFIYTSIVLTAEAIKRRYWEALDYCGGDERDGIVAQFLMKHPSANIRHKTAVSVYSQLRQQPNQTCLNFMRDRILQGAVLVGERAKQEHTAVKIDAPKQIQDMERRREYDRKAILGFGKRNIRRRLPF